MILSSVLAVMSNHTFPRVTSPRITGGIPKAAQHAVKLHQTLATYLSLSDSSLPFHCSRREDRIAVTGARSSNSDLSLTVCALQHAKPRDKMWQEAPALPLWRVTL